MRVFIVAIILIFNLQSWTKADDISDFQIEGMSIGDSALDYYDKDIINKRIDYWPGSKKYAVFWDNDFEISEIYDAVQLIYLSNDPNYIIKGISAGVFYDNGSINKCYDKQKEIFEELKSLFSNTKIRKDEKVKHQSDDSGKSIYTSIHFTFDNGDNAAISCFDFSKKMKKEKKWRDNLRITIYDNDHRVFLQTEAYK